MANKRLIDANALMDDVEMDGALYACLGAVDDVRFLVDSQPTVDAVEVVHAEWSIAERNKSARTVLVECCNCNAMFELPMFTFGFNYNYCPNCGAKMDGGNEDATD